MSQVHCYLSRRRTVAARRVFTAFARGSRARIVTSNKLLAGIPVFYGVDAYTLPLYREAVRQGRPFYYIDNGYFASKYHRGFAGERTYYRVTYCAPQHSGLGSSDGRRFADLGIELRNWQITGERILIACQSEWWYQRHGTTLARWLAEVREYLGGKDVIVRRKPISKREPQQPLAEVWPEVWAVVTHSSNVAVDALVQGIPVYCTGPCAASCLSGSLEDFAAAAPDYPLRNFPLDRRRWAEVLADNQWTMAELRDGTAWEALRSQAPDPQPLFPEGWPGANAAGVA